MNDRYNLAIMLCWLSFVLLLAGCEPRKDTQLEYEVLKTPASDRSMQPYLFSEKDALFMSWTEDLGEGNSSLVLSSLAGELWTEKVEMAQGSDWFVNWADFPGISKNGSKMIGHYLKKSDTATFAYDIRYLHSGNDGKDWSQYVKMHSDTVKAEHGFVSFSPLDDGSFLSVWLDGRNTSVDMGHESNQGHESHGAKGAMQLRSARIDSEGQISSEKLIDDRTCDCCQTSLLTTASGSIVAYRDRSENEIRDIYVSVLKEGKWSEPRPVHKDNWMINGCPVNGPKLAALDNSICLAWFTAADNQPEVKISFSDDGGFNFSEPVRVDEGWPMGRVDVAMLDQGKALVSWMESDANEGEIRLAIIDKEEGKVSSFKVTQVSGSRATGFPQLEVSGDYVFMAWNERIGEVKRVKLIRVDLDHIYP